MHKKPGRGSQGSLMCKSDEHVRKRRRCLEILARGWQYMVFATNGLAHSDLALKNSSGKHQGIKCPYFLIWPHFIRQGRNPCTNFVGKVQTLWKGHKNLKQSTTWFDIYLENVKSNGRLFHNLWPSKKTWSLYLGETMSL